MKTATAPAPAPKLVKIVLAVAHDGHPAGAELDVVASEASRLVHLGSARRVPTTSAEKLADDPKPDATWKATPIRAWAKRHGIAIPKGPKTVPELLAVIDEATAPPTTNPPAEAAEPEETA